VFARTRGLRCSRVRVDTLPGDVVPAHDFQETRVVGEAERQIIVAALERNDWHITRTARALGLADHASLLKIMRRHDITRERVDPDT